MSNDIGKIYGQRPRVRVSGLCWQRNRLLLVRHRMGANDFWAPPGGGVEFGQGMEEALFREFNEETGLIIMVERFRFITEFIERPLHAIEVFFDTKVIGGELKTGADPEMDRKKQIIEQAEFKEWKSILAIPNAEKHGIFRLCAKPKQLKSIAGFHRI